MPSVCDNKTKTADDVQQDNNIRLKIKKTINNLF